MLPVQIQIFVLCTISNKELSIQREKKVFLARLFGFLLSFIKFQCPKTTHFDLYIRESTFIVEVT